MIRAVPTLISRLRRAAGVEDRRSSPAVVVEDVTELHETAGRSSFRGMLERPRIGATRPGYSLPLSGWAFDGASTIVAIEVIHAEGLWQRLSLDRVRPALARAFPDQPQAGTSGFEALLNVAMLPREFELSLEAVLESGERVGLWSVRARRTALADRAVTRTLMRPIVLSSLGRTGSTWLMRLLGEHPEITVYRPFEFEPRLAGYWLEVFRNLSEPQSYLGSLRPKLAEQQWWLGRNGEPPVLPAEDERFERAIGGQALEELAVFCRRRSEEAYRALAREQGKPAASWFAEKSYRGLPSAGHLWDELFPHKREILLIRDLRDVVSSMRAYDEQRGFVGFGRESTADEAEFFRWIGDGSLALLARHRALGERSVLVRYEDLVEDPHRVLATVFHHLSIDASAGVVAGVVARASEETEGMRGHRTAPDAAASVGRWRRDMPPKLQEVAEAALADALLEYGYRS